MREPSSARFDANGVASSPSPPPPPPQHLLERLKDYGHEDAFALWDELSPDERDLLVKDIQVIHSFIQRHYSRAIFFFFFRSSVFINYSCFVFLLFLFDSEFHSLLEYIWLFDLISRSNQCRLPRNYRIEA